MTFGRPVMVDRSNRTPLPSLIDDEYLSTEGEGSQPMSVQPQMGLFVSSCELFDILNDILSTFYANDVCADTDSEPDMQDMVLEVLGFNRRLDSFITSIPDYLKATNTCDVASMRIYNSTSLQQQVLYCR